MKPAREGPPADVPLVPELVPLETVPVVKYDPCTHPVPEPYSIFRQAPEEPITRTRVPRERPPTRRYPVLGPDRTFRLAAVTLMIVPLDVDPLDVDPLDVDPLDVDPLLTVRR